MPGILGFRRGVGRPLVCSDRRGALGGLAELGASSPQLGGLAHAAGIERKPIGYVGTRCGRIQARMSGSLLKMSNFQAEDLIGHGPVLHLQGGGRLQLHAEPVRLTQEKDVSCH